VLAWYLGRVSDAVYGWKYRMESRHALNRRSEQSCVEGFLILHADGYGCVQPWPTLGHASLEDHWRALEQGGSLPLLERALLCAQMDGAARVESRSWWKNADVPRSHATITDLDEKELDLVEHGFTHAKLKVGVDGIEQLVHWSDHHPDCALRLDFNEVPTLAEMQSWFSMLPQRLIQRIDWIEDPFPFDAVQWRKWRQETGLRLALDRGLSDETAATEWQTIWKPAWQELPGTVAAESIVVTSAMDHPVGQCWAAYCAAQAGVKQVCGLRTDHLFANDDFLERMGPWCPAWPKLGGTGMGFDDLLEKLPWTRIR